MKVLMCDCCKKILPEKDIKYVGLEDRRIEVCKECEGKVRELKENFSKLDEALHEKYMEERKNFLNKLKEIGLEIWEEV